MSSLRDELDQLRDPRGPLQHAHEPPPHYMSLLKRPTATCKVSVSGQLKAAAAELIKDVRVEDVMISPIGPILDAAEAAAAEALQLCARAASGADSLGKLAEALARPAARLSAHTARVDACKEHVRQSSETARRVWTPLSECSITRLVSCEGLATGGGGDVGGGVGGDVGGGVGGGCDPAGGDGQDAQVARATVAEADEIILMGWSVFSFNEWGRADERCLVLSSHAVYRCRVDASGDVAVCSRVPLAALCGVRHKGRGVLALASRERDGRGNPLWRALPRKKQASAASERAYAAAVPVGVDAVKVGVLLGVAIDAARRLHCVGQELV